MLHAQQGSTFLEPESNPPTVQQEESDSDHDIPCFFDIEAMVNINIVFGQFIMTFFFFFFFWGSASYNFLMLSFRYLKWIYVRMIRIHILVEKVILLNLDQISQWVFCMQFFFMQKFNPDKFCFQHGNLAFMQVIYIYAHRILICNRIIFISLSMVKVTNIPINSKAFVILDEGWKYIAFFIIICVCY